MLPVLMVVLLVPALSYVTTEYVLIPKLKQGAGAAHAPEPDSHGAAEEGKKAKSGAHGSKSGGHGGKEKSGGSVGKLPFSHDFSDVVVNLAGAKGTRYLRARFTLAGSDPNLAMLIKSNEVQLKDLAIGILSSQTLENLEVSGARNAVRNELISQFNHVLHGEVVEQLFFSEFVVQ